MSNKLDDEKLRVGKLGAETGAIKKCGIREACYRDLSD